MKTNFKYLAMATVASMAVAFTSCSNNDEPGNVESQQPKTLLLKIENGTSTRTVSDPQAATSVDFASGDLYFLAGNGDILQHYSLSTSATDLAAGNISIADITQAGSEITNVPGYTKSICILGNTTGAPTTGNISAVQEFAIGVNSQKDLSTVNLYGESGALIRVLNQNDKFTCTVTVYPTTSRLEIPKLTASGAITAYKVTGIFIDNYYSTVGAGKDVLSKDLVGGSITPADFVGGSTLYPAAIDGLYDYEATAGAGIGVQTGLVTTPVAAPTTKVWGYNVLAGTGVADVAKVPRIIIRLTGITGVSGVTPTDVKFITVRGLNNNGTLLNSIFPGNVYHINGGITFDQNNLDDTPNKNINPINVNVTVTLATWQVVNVTPEL